MSRSPGHQKWPSHRVVETHADGKMVAMLDTPGGEVVAESDDVIVVEEDQHPKRYYFPRSDVRMEKLEPSSTTTECPFKGTARYFNLKSEDGRRFEDAVWSYEEPYDEHRSLKDRVAFYDDKVQQIRIAPE